MDRSDLVAKGGGYALDGWKQWPDDEAFSSQFVRILAAAQDGGSTIGECFQAAGKIAGGDREAWHRAWLVPAERNVARAQAAEATGHRLTARANWIRAANYFRTAEFFLDPHDARRLPTFDRIEACSHRALTLFEPVGEVVRVPYEHGAHIDAYFLPAPGSGRRAAIVAFGGLDEFKDELIQEMERYALARGLSLLLVDLPGQGGMLRRQGLTARHDTEVPVGACIDYLLTRDDVDAGRIAVYGASLGGYYVTRAAARERRIACAVADAMQWKVGQAAEALRADPDGMTATLSKWVFGARDMDELQRLAQPFDLEGVVRDIGCPFLIVAGELDAFGPQNAQNVYDEAKAAGVDVTIKWFSPEETGAAHCQIDNPTLGMEVICDWIADRLGRAKDHGP
jgi:dienelactone hydrolase